MSTRKRIRDYLSQGAELKLSMDRVVLQLSARKRAVLRSDDGKLTNAGKEWESLTGRVLRDGGFMGQEPVRRGNVERIKLRDGKMEVTRRWVPSQGE